MFGSSVQSCVQSLYNTDNRQRTTSEAPCLFHFQCFVISETSNVMKRMEQWCCITALNAFLFKHCVFSILTTESALSSSQKNILLSVVNKLRTCCHWSRTSPQTKFCLSAFTYFTAPGGADIFILMNNNLSLFWTWKLACVWVNSGQSFVWQTLKRVWDPINRDASSNIELQLLDETGVWCICVKTRLPHSQTQGPAHVKSGTKLSNSHPAKTLLKANKTALWSLLPDTANYQYGISILSVRGNRGINFRPLCFLSSISWSRLCLLTNLLSCFDHKCDYHHTRDNKTPYLCCTKEHELKPKL